MSTEPSTDTPVVAARRRQLQRWIDEKHAGSHKDFIAATFDGEKQINQGELSGLLRRKSFGEKRARSLEKLAGMPAMYLDERGSKRPESSAEAVVHTLREAAPGESPAPAQSPPAWPFHRVTLARIANLRRALGGRRATQAMDDLDELLDVAVTKWERRAAAATKSAK